ncbi:MAG: NUDIX hydrolase [Myxococcota bacterium]
MSGDDAGWRIRHSRTLFESAWFRLQQDDITLPNGDDITYTWVDHGGYVVVVPVLADGRVVMERVYRHTLGRTLLECPAGSLDGDAPLTAGARELEEETGYRAQQWQELATFSGSPGISNEQFHVLLARDLSDDGTLRRENTEQMEIELWSFDELHRMALSGEIDDGPSALALLVAAPALRA